jgi:ribosomal protein S27E
MNCEHHLVLVNVKNGKVECAFCGKEINKPKGRAKTFSDLAKHKKLLTAIGKL